MVIQLCSLVSHYTLGDKNMRDILVAAGFAVGMFVGHVATKSQGAPIAQSENVRVDVPTGNSIDRAVYEVQFVAAMNANEHAPAFEIPSPKNTVKITFRDADGKPVAYIYQVRLTTQE